jgi:serine O-acetyltransferase
MTRHPLSDRLRGLTREIVDSYRSALPEGAPAVHLDPNRRLPSRRATVEIVDQLFAVLYPGFYGAQHLTWENVEYHVGALLDDIATGLAEQMRLAYGFESQLPLEEIERRTADAVDRFFHRLPELRRMLMLDAAAAMEGDPAARSFAEIFFAYPGFAAISVQRLAHELWQIGVPLLPRIMTEHAHSQTGIDIHPGARIGESFFIDHGTGVVIGETAVIGNRVKIYQGVTLGALSFPRDAAGRLQRDTKRHPTLGDQVVVYAGATILGGKTVVGDRAVIGGNTWVIESVAPGERVLNTRTSLAQQRKILEQFLDYGEGI